MHPDSHTIRLKRIKRTLAKGSTAGHESSHRGLLSFCGMNFPIKKPQFGITKCVHIYIYMYPTTLQIPQKTDSLLFTNLKFRSFWDDWIATSSQHPVATGGNKMYLPPGRGNSMKLSPIYPVTPQLHREVLS